jgi:nickel superoxide dismutase
LLRTILILDRKDRIHYHVLTNEIRFFHNPEDKMIHKIMQILDTKFNFDRASAHCDIPCGIYDPITAQIAALTVVRMIDLMTDLEAKGGDKGKDYFNTMARYVAVKEEHAEKAKHDVRVIMGDYFKAPHVEKYPDLPTQVHKIMQLGSKVRQTTDRQAALDLVEAINQFAEVFWTTKNVAVKRAKAPYAPGLELVYPAL